MRYTVFTHFLCFAFSNRGHKNFVVSLNEVKTKNGYRRRQEKDFRVANVLIVSQRRPRSEDDTLRMELSRKL
jgi:hypothetical protein